MNAINEPGHRKICLGIGQILLGSFADCNMKPPKEQNGCYSLIEWVPNDMTVASLTW